MRNPRAILRSMEKKADGSDKLRAVMVARKISRDTLSLLLNKPTRTVDDWISRKSKKVDGTAEMIAEELLAEMEFPPQLQHLWALLAARYERVHGKPVPKKGERRGKKRR